MNEKQWIVIVEKMNGFALLNFKIFCVNALRPPYYGAPTMPHPHVVTTPLNCDKTRDFHLSYVSMEGYIGCCFSLCPARYLYDDGTDPAWNFAWQYILFQDRFCDTGYPRETVKSEILALNFPIWLWISRKRKVTALHVNYSLTSVDESKSQGCSPPPSESAPHRADLCLADALV